MRGEGKEGGKEEREGAKTLRGETREEEERETAAAIHTAINTHTHTHIPTFTHSQSHIYIGIECVDNKRGNPWATPKAKREGTQSKGGR